jgi:hypothetical protein
MFMPGQAWLIFTKTPVGSGAFIEAASKCAPTSPPEHPEKRSPRLHIY